MSLKNISIRYQILIPIAMLVVATFSVLFFAKYEVESAIESVSNTARQAAADKDKVTKLADLAWAMRVEAIYGIYDEQRAKEMDANVAKLSREAMTITRELSQTVALRDLASRIETSVSEYSRYTQRQAKPTILSYFNQELEEVRYNAMVSEYRAKGADMMEDINALSLFINPLVEKDLKASDVEADQMIMTAGVAMSGAMIVAMLFGWWMSGVIVKPLLELQDVMRKLAGGDLNVKASDEGTNELSRLGRDANQTIGQLRSTVGTWLCCLIRLEDMAA